MIECPKGVDIDTCSTHIGYRHAILIKVSVLQRLSLTGLPNYFVLITSFYQDHFIYMQIFLIKS